ncbi:transporter substrate-binding domain-containing protein [Actinokineospora sp. NBRC 105648]|uniref:transporter substrate-binding domain-containing protein n=1 Tax=Actinokineospora sp. NBRC 105648 TaxID=3032206 RepID=UPI0024A2F729|nr:transporter substrate-binding domain-containing protein [Actinokineospora sp. NBRC 105648]GLZ40690.1 ABC transporter substrate-binding protein [Actinokineospora sp. NBRC 105648]
MSRLLALAAALVCLAGCSAPPVAPPEQPGGPFAMPEGYVELPGRSGTNCTDVPDRSLDPALGPHGADGRPDGDAVARIRREGLVVGVSQTASFFSKRDLVTGQLDGFEVDIANRIAAALLPGFVAGDERLRLVSLPTGRRLGALDTAENTQAKAANPTLSEVPRVDMVIADVSVTCGRVATYGLRYSKPYLATNSGLLVRQGVDGVKTPDDLGGRKVCSGGQTTNSEEMIDTRARQVQADQPALIPVAVADTSDCLMLLQRGLVDAIYTDVLILHGFRDQDPGTVLLDYHDEGQGKAAVAVSNKHDDLVRFVNSVLDDMRRDGSLQRGYDTWFKDVPATHRRALPNDPYQG